MVENNVYLRSEHSIKEKFHQCITILEVSICMVDKFEIDEFLAVIATQLRILLCDTKNRKENSLILKVIDNPKFLTFSDRFKSPSYLNGTPKKVSDMFDDNSKYVELEEWLNQEFLGFWGTDKLSLREIIKAFADKDGGAHTDSELKEKDMYTIVSASDHLLYVAQYIIKCTGRDYHKEINDLIIDRAKVL